MAQVDILVPVLANAEDLFKLVKDKISRLDCCDSFKNNFRYVFIWTSKDSNYDFKSDYLSQKYGAIFQILFYQQRGIYKALNHYLETSNSDYYIFEGDTDQIDFDVIDSELSNLNIEAGRQPDLIIGLVEDFDTKKILKPYRLPLIGYGANFSVGVIVNRVALPYGRFDENYKIAADTKFILKCIREKKIILKSGSIFGRFKRDGISTLNYKSTVLEHFKALWDVKFFIEALIFISLRLVKIVIR